MYLIQEAEKDLSFFVFFAITYNLKLSGIWL